MQRTIYLLIEFGKTPTFASIAAACGISRQAVWKFFRVNPGFVPWLDGELTQSNGHLVAALARRHWQIGMQGSVPSAEFFMKVQSGYFLRQLGPWNGEASSDGQVPTNGGAIINILCPRPEVYAQAFNQEPNATPSAGVVLPGAPPAAQAPTSGHTVYGAPLPANIPVIPVKATP